MRNRKKSLSHGIKLNTNHKTNENSEKFSSHILHFFSGKEIFSGLYSCMFTRAQTVCHSLN